MRPTAVQPSARQTPLTLALGTAARVTVLRVLCGASTPLSVPALATESKLNVRGIPRVLDELEAIGAVESTSGGGSRRAVIRDEWPLTASLRALFVVERETAARLLPQLHTAINALRPHPIAVWMNGAHADGTDQPGDAIRVALLTDAASASRLGRELERAMMTMIANDLTVPIEVESLTRSDIAVAKALPESERRSALRGPRTVLSGVDPLALVDGSSGNDRSMQRTHADKDADALQRGRAIAALIRKDASLIARACQAVESRKERASLRLHESLDDWARLLRTSSPTTLARLLVDPSDKMTRLRQTLPFLDVLRADERERYEQLLVRDSPKSVRSTMKAQ